MNRRNFRPAAAPALSTLDLAANDVFRSRQYALRAVAMPAYLDDVAYYLGRAADRLAAAGYRDVTYFVTNVQGCAQH